MTMLDSCADFLSEFHGAVEDFAREVHHYSAPDDPEGGWYNDKIDALRDACRKVIVSHSDDRPFDFEAAAELLRLAATLHEGPETG